MKNFSLLIKLLFTLFLGIFISGSVIAQTCTTPVFTSIGNSGPVCQGGTLSLNAAGTVGGVSSGFIRMAGIGANQGDRSFDQVFSSGDRAGSIARITNAQFDAVFAGLTTDAARAAAIKAKYDVLMFTWASPTDVGLTWSLVTAYLSTGGSIFLDGDYANVLRLNDGTPNSIVGVSAGTTAGCNYTLVNPAPFPALVANGVNGCFANDHLYVSSFPTWMKAYITAAGRNLAVAGIYPGGNQGRLIVQGPDQDYHADRTGSGTALNQYKMILNQIDFLKANQSGITWTGPNGFTSNDANPFITNVTAANAGVYTATLTNITGGGCFVTATTTVEVTSTIPTITASGSTNLCTGGSVTLTSSSGSTYHWSNGATTKSITVNTAGNYTVTVTNTGGCSGVSAATAVTVNPLPVASITADGPTTFCPSGSVTLTTSPAASYLWTTGDSTRSITVHTAGNYQVTVKNLSGCSATSSATSVTVQDTQNPVFTSTQANAIVTLDAISGTAVLGDYVTGVTATDDCSISTITQFPLAGTPLVVNEPLTVTLTITDPTGNSSTQSFTVTAADKTAPVVPVLADISAECSTLATAPTATDNLAGNVVGTTTDPLSYSVQGSYVIHWSFDDGNGNVSTATQNVIIKDVTAPILPVLADVTGECSATAIVPTALDNCAGLVTGVTSDALSYTTQGIHAIRWKFDDGNGNVSLVTQNVVIKDITAPILPVLADVTGECSATAIVPTALDNCAGLVTGVT
ncbi:MAG: hypothetical protein H7289_01810, partial [Mucilaginibacter sp.]|nr:hypothetical protein [Mucilaginibacter sp.]